MGDDTDSSRAPLEQLETQPAATPDQAVRDAANAPPDRILTVPVKMLSPLPAIVVVNWRVGQFEEVTLTSQQVGESEVSPISIPGKAT
jgi:hypothetical protein